MIRDDRYSKHRSCVAVLALALGLVAGETRAQSPLGSPAAKPSFASAVASLKASGTALVFVVTSEARPESKTFFRAFSESPWARGHQGFVEILELSAEENASTLERWKISTAPVVLVYTRGADSPVCRGMKAPSSVNEVVAWLDTFAIGVPAMKPGQLDEGLLRVNYNGFPSPQTPQTSQPMAPAPVAPAPVAPYPVAPTAPAAMTPATTPVYPMAMMAAPAPVAAPTSMVQLPTHNVVVQQSQPNVFVQQTAPAPMAMASMAMVPAAPSAMMAMPAPAAPTAMMAMAAAAPVASPMTFAAAPVASPLAFAAAPVASPMPVAALPAASSPAGFTVTNSNIPLSTSRNTNRLRVRPASLRTRIGQWLVDGGRGATIETQNSIELNGSQSQGGGIANLSTSQAQPVAPQMTTHMFAPPQPVAPPVTQPVAPPSPQAPAPPMPSPQYPVRQGHKWLD